MKTLSLTLDSYPIDFFQRAGQRGEWKNAANNSKSAESEPIEFRD